MRGSLAPVPSIITSGLVQSRWERGFFRNCPEESRRRRLLRPGVTLANLRLMGKLTVKAVQDKLQKANGNLTAAARHLGVARNSLAEFIHRRPALGKVLADCRESRVDTAESGLDKAIKNGEAWAIALTLKTLGARRGYAEPAAERSAEAAAQALAVLAAFERLTRGGPDLPPQADEVRLRITRILDDAAGTAEPDADAGPAAAGETPLAAGDAL